jgi:hypothetical protein
VVPWRLDQVGLTKPFFVMFRFYRPQKPIVDKSWVLNDAYMTAQKICTRYA